MSVKEDVIISEDSGLREVAFNQSFSPSLQFLAWQDFKESMQKWRIWLMLAYQDIRLRYRRSILGPFWITLSMAITVYSMGYLYGHLFHMPISQYFPYLVGGMLAWSLISTTVTDLVEAFSYSESMLKQIKLPYILYVHRIVARNLIIFFHNLLVIIPIFIFFHDSVKINLNTLLLIPNLIIIYFNALCYGIALSMLGARYRDISQIIKSFVSVVFFVTPIMWKPDLLPPDKRFIILLNPFYSFVEFIRAPLIGHIPTTINFAVVAIMTLLGIIISYYLFPSRRARIIYWI